MTQPIIINTGRSSSKSKSLKCSSIPRIIFRLTIYPTLIYILVIYYMTKSDDPNGFKNVRNAFTFGKKEPLNVFDFTKIDIKERIDHEDYLEAESSANARDKNLKTSESKQPKTSSPSLVNEIFDLRNKLIDESITCHKLNFLLKKNNINTNVACYDDFAYYERLLDQKLAKNALIHSVQLLNVFKKIHEAIKRTRDPEYIKFIKNCGENCSEGSLSFDGPKSDLNDITDKIDKLAQIVSKYLTHCHNNYDPTNPAEKDYGEVEYNFVTKSIHDQALSFINANYHLISRQLDPRIVKDLPSELTSNIKA